MGIKILAHKSCSKCNIDKPFSFFPFSKRREDGREITCRECRNSKRRKTRDFLQSDITDKRIKTFFSYVQQTDKCWNWTKNTLPRGYGLFFLAGKNILAHRFSFLYHFGCLPNELHVCHECDNPKCVNPTHLFLGTDKDNLQDMARKGVRKGEKHAITKLTNENVFHIKELLRDGISYDEIAKIYNTSRGIVYNIKIGLTWTHIKL